MMIEIVKQVSHLTSEQLAERYQIHPRTVANWRVKGEGPRFIKVGSRVLYSVVEVERWESEQTRKSTVDGHGR